MSSTPTEDDRTDEQERFDSTPVTRRQFTRLVAITGGAITLPSTGATAQVASSKLTDFYEFVVTQTPDDYAVSTLIHLDDESGFDALDSAGIDARTTTDPETAAYAELTRAQTETVADLEAVTELRFTSGANPFWRLDGYPDGVVFTDPLESVEHVGYDETVAGLQHLAEQHHDRLRVDLIGKSPGFYDQYADEYAGEEVIVAELTNDVRDDEGFREKPKAMATLSIHGNERAGVEGGTRFIEKVLNGDYPDVDAVLDDVALVFVFPNPDGWLLGRPEYTRAADDSVTEYLNERTRGNAGVGDTNRQYPTLGQIDPANYPSEPNGANLIDDEPGIDDDVPSAIETNMPDGLAIAERLRNYENLEYCVDLHNKGWGEDYCYGFTINGEYDLDHLNAAYELNRRILPQMDEEIGSLLDERRQTILEYLDEPSESDVATVPFVYGTLLSTLGYTTTGSLMGWMSQDPEMGGLDVKTLAYELPSVNDPPVPELIDINAAAYEIVLRETALHTTRDVDVTVETDGARTAYVTTDALSRTSESLSFAGAKSETTREVETVTQGWESATVEVAPGTNSLSLTLNPDDDRLLARLVDPNGSTVAQHNQSRDHGERIEWYTSEPEAGEWTIEMKNLQGGERNDVLIEINTVLSEGSGVETPDPSDVLGFEQRNYETTPFDFFQDYRKFVGGAGSGPGRGRGRGNGDDDGRGRGNGRGRGRGKDKKNDRGPPGRNGTIAPISVDEIRKGALFRGNSDNRAYDNLVVIHTEGQNDDAYREAVDEFVDAGGNVVLTDTGVGLLATMDNGLVSDVSAGSIFEQEVYVPQLTERNSDHPLLVDTRDNWRELWKPTPLGYPGAFDGASPITVVDRTAFENAGGSAAGYCQQSVFAPVPDDAPVAAGSFGDGRDDGAVHVIAGMLPPVRQTELHPFGMEDYAASYFTQTVLTNALGYRQHRFVDGNEVLTIGD